jgi:Amt family ammonium transporter
LIFGRSDPYNPQIDDPLDAVAVHFCAGLWGILAAPIFMTTGILFGGGEPAAMMLAWNAVAAVAFMAWYGVTAVLTFGLLMMLKVFRVNEAHEIQGLDVVKHNEPAYPIDAYIEEEIIPPMPPPGHSQVPGARSPCSMSSGASGL